MGKSQKTYMSIKSKLMAAVAMLLVASFMVVSSTYAWFTLSTAPEITGIKTSIGANGNLEIALLDSETATLSELATLAAAVGNTTGGLQLVDKNKTWGNLVSVSETDSDPYGLSNITLVPSRLALAGATTLSVDGPLSVPTYGADGRIESLSSAATVHGTWTGTGFAEGGTGVRAIGTVSNMTQAELDYRLARLAYASAINNAYTLTNNTLNANKQGMVTSVMAVAMGTAGPYDVTSLATMIKDLNGNETTKGVVAYLNEARKNIVKALYIVGASTTDTYASPTDVTFDESTGVPTVVTTAGSIQVSEVTNLQDYVGLVGRIEAIEDALDAANTALAPYSNIYTDVATADEVKAILNPLFNTTAVKVGSGDKEIGIGELRTKLKEEGGFESVGVNNAADVMNWLKAEGYVGEGNVIDAKMGEGSGIFADVHQATGRAISASAEAMLIFTIRMRTSVATTYAVTYATDSAATLGSTDIPYPTVAEGSESTDLTDYYGYALDFAFRTNAKESNLQLQTTATNRIYSDGGADTTMGGGSVMRFKSSDPDFNEEDIANLMKSIRIVFVDDMGEIVAVAGAKTADFTDDKGNTEKRVSYRSEVEGADTYVIADIVLYNYSFVYVAADDTVEGDETINNGKITIGDMLVDVEGTDEDESCKLLALEQNKATALSAYVYLDGDAVENGDVAANATESMTGSINLQFSSDADLKPMEYADLMNPSQNTDTPAQSGESGT